MKSIVDQFKINGEFLEARRFGTGHLHDTFLVNMAPQQRPVPYIFQRINHFAFRDPGILMENIVRVTGFIRQKLEARHLTGRDLSRRVLSVIFTRDGHSFYRDTDGHCWRVYLFIEGARTYDSLESLEQAYQVALMFGRFLALLEDFPGPPLHETIPDFHNGPKRLKDFREALASDTHNHAYSAKTDIDFLLERASWFEVIPGLIHRGDIPIRISHNDTKINNVMLDDSTGEGICVIDLDTVMNGSSLFDFGDLARTTLSPRDEDERDLSNVVAEMPRFEAILKGYLAGAGQVLTPKEKEYLVFSCKFMPLLIGLRFLTDYLLGDVYFKIHRPGQNLDRCRRQFKLVRSITDQEEKMKKIVGNCSSPMKEW